MRPVTEILTLPYFIKGRILLPCFSSAYLPELNAILLSEVKVKASRNRPGVPQRVPGGQGSQISWHSTRECGGVVSLTHRNMSLKNPMTPPGIDPGTVRLVAQPLNHYATPGPTFWSTFAKFEKFLLASSCLSVRVSAWGNSAPNERIFMKLDIWLFFKNLSRKFAFN